jgi:hypothetical protein
MAGRDAAIAAAPLYRHLDHEGGFMVGQVMELLATSRPWSVHHGGSD